MTDRLDRLERHLDHVLAGPRRLMRSLSKTTTGNYAMTTKPETVADVLEHMRDNGWPATDWADRIESALTAKAEAVAGCGWPECPHGADCVHAAPVESLGRDVPDVSSRIEIAIEFDGGERAEIKAYGSARDMKRLESRIHYWENRRKGNE